MIYILFGLGFISAFLYMLLIAKYFDGWNQTKAFPSQQSSPSTKITVIVAARNEEKNILSCVDSILKNQYPSDLWELIVVDNASTDGTLNVLAGIHSTQLRVLSQDQGYKKEALELAISYASGDLIVCTDADCIVSPFWLQHMSFQYEIHDVNFILGPVAIKDCNSTISRFQALDMLAMMGVTAGGLVQDLSYLANGANMAFAKKIYTEIGGFPRKEIASGDDVFLLHEFVKIDKSKIAFQKTKAAIVQTQAETKWKELLQQRIRWASKTGSYIHNKEKLVSAFVFSFCAYISILFVLTPWTSGLSFFIGLFLLFIKGCIDFMFLTKVNDFFQMKKLMKFYPISFMLHFIYIIIAGTSSILGLRYNWKGRKPAA